MLCAGPDDGHGDIDPARGRAGSYVVIQSIDRFLTRYSHQHWALADQGMVSGVNFLTGLLLARYLGLEEFGRFTLAWMAVLFVNSIQHAAISAPMMSIGPKQPEAEAPAYYGAVMAQQLALGFLAFVLVWIGVSFSAVIFPEWRVASLAWPVAWAAITHQFQDFLRRYFFIRGRSRVAFANDAIRYLGQIAVLIWIFSHFRDAMDSTKVLWLIALTAAVAIAFGMISVERIDIDTRKIRTTTSRHWRFSKWLTASALLQWTTGNLFIIAAGALLGASAVGALKAAQNLMGVVHILFMGLENIVPARAARHFHEGGKNALYGYLKRVTLLGGGATAVAAAVAASAPDFWLGLVFGDQYIDYGYLLRWWAVINLVGFLDVPLRSGLRAIEDTRSIFRAHLWGTLFSLVAVYPMVDSFGLVGAIVGVFLVVVLVRCLLARAAVRHKILFI